MYHSLEVSARQSFAPTYGEAREGFVQEAGRVHLDVDSVAHPLKGPQDEALFTDIVWIGPKTAENVLVLLSATHGVEGFCGSGAQRDGLTYLNEKSLPANVAVCMVHALNPYGFAWLRRVNEDGVDLNRNFVDFDLPLPQNPGYDQLADALLADPRDKAALQVLLTYQQEHGEKELQRAIIGGQFKHPTGLFYGGTKPSWSRLQTEALVDRYGLKQRKQVAVIDFHTGLGPFGYGEPICDHAPDSVGAARCKAWYGHSVTLPALGTSTSLANAGLSDYGWQRMLGDKVAFIALEFGTFDLESLFDALKADHRLHKSGSVDWLAPETQQVKQQLKNFFYPATLDWQEMVLFRARQVIAQALKGLSE